MNKPYMNTNIDIWRLQNGLNHSFSLTAINFKSKTVCSHEL